MPSMSSMNLTIKQNRSLLTSKKEKFKGNNREGIYSSKNERKNLLKFKTASKYELQKIKQNIRNRAEIAHQKEIIYYGTLFGVITLLVILFLHTP